MVRSVHEPPLEAAQEPASTLDDKRPLDEKHPVVDSEGGHGAYMENGHLQELEVDMGIILKEDGLEDIEGDQSPYPEGNFPSEMISDKT